MLSILVANPKGGSGKSTLATNLAGYLARSGARVMLGDLDRQQSARRWLETRPALHPAIGTWDISPDQPARPPKGTSHVVLDSPAGFKEKRLAAVLKMVQRVIVPLQPSTFDMRATADFLEILMQEKAVRRHEAFVAVVGMRVDPRTRAAQDLERFLADYDLPVLAFLRNTQFYIQAAAQGLTLFDFPESRVARDREQWQPIVNWLGGTGAE